MTTRQSIEAAIAALAIIPNARPRIDFVYSGSPLPYTQDVWNAIHCMGGKLKTGLYMPEGKPPYVIDSMTMTIDGVEVHVQRDRKPTDNELGHSGRCTTSVSGSKSALIAGG